MKGFTLIEIIIYTALVAMVLGTAVLATNTALQTRSSTRNALILEESLRFAMRQITETINRAESVTTPLLDAPGNTLTLDMRIAAEDPTVFTLSAGTITKTEGTGTPTALIPPNVEVTALTFRRLAGSPAPVSILINGRTRGTGSTRFTATLDLTAIALPHR